MNFILLVMSFIMGSIIGSFLNVCIYRIPRGESLVFPRSSCPKCKHTLSWYELVPIVSFIGLRGKCKNCREPISWRYPCVELLTGILFLGIFLRFGFELTTIKAWMFVSIVTVVAFIDAENMIIPNTISLPGTALGLILSYSMFFNSVIGALIGFIIIGLVIYFSKGGMGWGDAKLLAMVGAFWGWKIMIYTLFVSCLIGSIVGIELLITKKIQRKTPVPFGPFLCLGAFIVFMWFGR